MKEICRRKGIEQQMLCLYKLTPLEKRVVSLVIEGYSNIEIGNLLHTTPKTISGYMTRIMRKTQILNRIRLAYLVGCLEDKSEFIYIPKA